MALALIIVLHPELALNLVAFERIEKLPSYITMAGEGVKFLATRIFRLFLPFSF
jgi:hypothetical protein